MESTYAIDAHKLHLHPQRVGQWLDAGDDWEKLKKIYPIYVELSPIGACNHRCVFCAMDYIGYQPQSLSVKIMRQRLPEMSALGLKSVMFAGEGEPLLCKHIDDLADIAYQAGIDIAFTTNGVLMSDRFMRETLPKSSWIKISLNAGTAETYARIHGTRQEDFDRVLQSLRTAITLRAQTNCRTTIGAQTLLLPENANEIKALAKICRDDLGLDYLVIKPYSQHQSSHTRRYADIDYNAFATMKQEFESYARDTFKIIYREQTILKHEKRKQYARCLATPFFWGHVMSDGSVFSCSSYLCDQRFCLGNINQNSFQEIWEGSRRRENIALMQKGFDLTQCRTNCRMDAINNYLWQLDNPHPHVNFI